jgi:protein-tyrosine phosphatase
MAEALLREMLSKSDVAGDWRIASAGTWALDGRPPMPNAIRVMSMRDIDIREHRSRSVDHTPLDEYALILVMEQGHKESLRWEFPEVADRVHLMTEMVGNSHDVLDPVAGDMRDHIQTADAIQDILADGFARIRDLSRPGSAI